MNPTQADEALHQRAIEIADMLEITPYAKSILAGQISQAINEATADLRTQLADAQKKLAAVCAAGQEVVNRWDSPSWKWDDEHTGHKVHRLRDAIAATRQPTQDKGE